jgi:hypothetical protein
MRGNNQLSYIAPRNTTLDETNDKNSSQAPPDKSHFTFLS